jgi:hypothetical protein
MTGLVLADFSLASNESCNIFIKLSLCSIKYHEMNTSGGGGSEVLVTSEVDGRESASRPGRFTSGEKTLVAIG